MPQNSSLTANQFCGRTSVLTSLLDGSAAESVAIPIRQSRVTEWYESAVLMPLRTTTASCSRRTVRSAEGTGEAATVASGGAETELAVLGTKIQELNIYVYFVALENDLAYFWYLVR